MFDDIKKQNTFSRTIENERKMGAYYTDISHCRDIFKMFEFPKDKEVSVIEPSIGDAKAVIAVTGADTNPCIKIFGVELNNRVAADLKQNPYIEDILSADFLNGVFISNNVFSFCFGNPPYLTDTIEDGGRDERSFLEKVTNYMMNDGVVCWIIPYRQYMDKIFLRYWMNHYREEAVYRFRASEYAKYQQVVIVGRKIKGLSNVLTMEAIDKFIESHALENIKELPTDFDTKIRINESSSDAVKLFMKKEFDVAEAYDSISGGAVQDILRNAGNLASIPEYISSDLGRPPTELKKDSKYLLATAGAGQGLTGTDGEDLHLQRGVAEIVEEKEATEDTASDKTYIKVTSRTSVTMTIVENSGKITVLQ